MSPFYGLDDPSFRDVVAAEVVVGMAQFHPTVKVLSVYVLKDAGGMTDVLINVSEDESLTAEEIEQEQSVVFNA